MIKGLRNGQPFSTGNKYFDFWVSEQIKLLYSLPYFNIFGKLEAFIELLVSLLGDNQNPIIRVFSKHVGNLGKADK